MIIADYHMHSHNSGDSQAPMKDMIEASIEKGLKEICFTEHMDLDFPLLPDLPPDPFNLDIKSYKEELYKYRELYKDKLSIKFGIEVGMQPQIADKNSEIVRGEDFDFVIASIHLVDRNDPYYGDIWESHTVEEVLTRFFELTLENLKLFNDYDVLGHLDYIARYVPNGDKTYSYDRFKDIIDEILSHIIKADKGIEFNSKVLGSSTELDPNPCPAALKRYKELGGKLLTFGADAHKPETIACGYDRARQIALDAGFTEYYTFDKRVPIVHKL